MIELLAEAIKGLNKFMDVQGKALDYRLEVRATEDYQTAIVVSRGKDVLYECKIDGDYTVERAAKSLIMHILRKGLQV